MSIRSQTLALLVATPGMTAEDLAAEMFPPPKRTKPFASTADLLAWREAKTEHRRTTSAKVATALDGLRAAGLVEPCQPPHLSAWFVASMDRHGLAMAVERAHPDWPREVADLSANRAMVATVAKGPGSVRALLGDNPCGARKRVYGELCDAGVIVAPTHRWPTAAGVARVVGAKVAA